MRVIVVGFYLLLMGLIFTLPFSLLTRVGGVAALLLNLSWLWNSRFELNGAGITLHYDHMGWRLSVEGTACSSCSVELELLDEWFVSTYLIAMDFRSCDGHRRYGVVVLPDSLKQDDYRRLSIHLRWLESVESSTEP